MLRLKGLNLLLASLLALTSFLPIPAFTPAADARQLHAPASTPAPLGFWKAEPLSPTGVIVDKTPTFTWKKADDIAGIAGQKVTGYEIRVYKGTTVAYTYSIGKTTSYTPTTAISPGSYTWNIRANYSRNGWQAFSSAIAFTLTTNTATASITPSPTISPTATITLTPTKTFTPGPSPTPSPTAIPKDVGVPVSPSGVQNSNPPIFTWKKASKIDINPFRSEDVTDYNLVLVRAGSIATEYNQPNSSCQAAVCNFTPPAQITAGSYIWKVRAKYESTGWHAFGPMMSFSVQENAPTPTKTLVPSRTPTQVVYTGRPPTLIAP